MINFKLLAQIEPEKSMSINVAICEKISYLDSIFVKSKDGFLEGDLEKINSFIGDIENQSGILANCDKNHFGCMYFDKRTAIEDIKAWKMFFECSDR